MLADGVLAQGDSDLAELRLEAGLEAADFDRHEGAVIGLQPEFSHVTVTQSGQLLDKDVDGSMDALAPGSAAALIMVENTWAVPLVQAIERCGDELVDQVRIPRGDVVSAFDASQPPSFATSD